MKRFDSKKRFRREFYGCVIVTTLLLFVFYFIYRTIFGKAFPSFVGAPMLTIFAVLDIILAYVYLKIENKRCQNSYYIADDEKLISHHGGKTQHWYWQNFTGARTSTAFNSSRFPIEFLYLGQPISMSTYVDDPAGLTNEILNRIKDFCPVEKEIELLVK